MRPQQIAGPPTTREAPPPAAIAGGSAGPFEAAFVAGPDAPLAARAAVGGWMGGHVSEATLADAQLLVNELVANSVRHADAPAGAMIDVRAHIGADILRLEVGDRGTSGSVSRRAPDRQRGGGFGLNIVETLSRRWGVDRGAGTHVWAELPLRATS
jgi:anti-sigma regulatory factor (Ser/Thr protein kinase)